MSNTLLQEATSDSSVMSSVASAVKSIFPTVSLGSAADVQAFVNAVLSNSTELAAIESKLSALASSKGLTFVKDVSAAISVAEATAAIAKFKSGTSSVSIPSGTPIMLIVVAAILLFAPSILGVS